jgi:hypothetical protein
LRYLHGNPQSGDIGRGKIKVAQLVDAGDGNRGTTCQNGTYQACPGYLIEEFHINALNIFFIVLQ